MSVAPKERPDAVRQFFWHITDRYLGSRQQGRAVAVE